ncbi:MAG TPA: sigma-70 family RNA polymerase sigma factor [Planctomycetota bacterium]
MDAVDLRDEDVARLARFVERGDRAAMGLLFASHADGAYRLALRIRGNAADAEDAVQVAFLEVLRHAAQYRGASSVRSWIFGFVVNACRHKAREEGRRAAREERAATSEAAPPEARELQAAVRSAVQELPDPYRVPVWLHYCEGLSSGEVADSLGVSENTVRSQLSRGVDQLRGALADAGLSVGASAVTAALGAAALESAPASLTASLSSLASGAAPAGLAAKAAAATACFAALVATSAALWWGGEPDAPPPPDLARIERIVREWQPRPEEKRFDEIGWAPSLREARRMSKETRRPVAILTLSGPLQKGRSDGGSLNLRGVVLCDPRVIDLLNSRFVPVYYESEERPADPEEHAERRRVVAEASKAGLGTGSEHLYFLAPDGRVTATAYVCHATADNLAARLAELGAEAGAPLVPPAPQCAPPAVPPGGLLLHLTARYLDVQGQVETKRPSYHEFPAEEWLALSSADAAAFAPPGVPRVGQSWEIDARRLYALFFPLTGNWKPESNLIRAHAMTARVISAGRKTAWVRLEGRLSMEHRFFPSKDERPVETAVLGFAEVDVETRAPRSLRLVTEDAAYGKERFGVAVRSVR